jgi:hypothetical protein
MSVWIVAGDGNECVDGLQQGLMATAMIALMVDGNGDECVDGCGAGDECVDG